MSDAPDNRPELRISDTDRDRTAEVLREAHAHGRITADELDERLTSVYAAKTYADLVPITRDLPAVQDAAAPVRVRGSRIGGAPRFRMSLAILGGASRGGAWVVPPEYKAIATLGGIKLDMSDSTFAEPETVIKAYAVMGGMEITVPADAEVDVGAVGIMGGVDHGGEGPGVPGGPRIRIVGVAVLGGIEVKRAAARRPRRAELPSSG
ncbi:MAG TPA: DUF1707 domain-containing protein [Streptosporangiaceae bacterium]|nr:DUF1707 domain-containing protein [Streptosporangiaceae bacterium]